jgi:ribulose-5-phosphate 4-epimerase/fuculose-1-phosphate aldolase
MGRLLEPITQDAACFFEDHVVIKDEAGAVAVKAEAGHSVAAAFGNNRAALHQNHGLLTASRHSIDDAAFGSSRWSAAAGFNCLRRRRASPTMVSPERARYSKEHVGNSFIGWLHFQPVYDQIVQANPDMFD